MVIDIITQIDTQKEKKTTRKEANLLQTCKKEKKVLVSTHQVARGELFPRTTILVSS